MNKINKVAFCKICNKEMETPYINHLNGEHGISKLGREAWKYTEVIRFE